MCSHSLRRAEEKTRDSVDEIDFGSYYEDHMDDWTTVQKIQNMVGSDVKKTLILLYTYTFLVFF